MMTSHRISKARQIAQHGLCKVVSRDQQGRARTVTVPGSNGKQYQVIIRRFPGHWTTECRLDCGFGNYEPCPGNTKTVCYHSLAAIFAAAGENGHRVHSVTDNLKSASRLKNLTGNGIIRSLCSHQQTGMKKWFHLVVVKKKTVEEDIRDLFG